MDDRDIEQTYFSSLAGAFVRGRLGMDDENDAALIRAGRGAGLRLHKFKQGTLPRVQKVLGILRGISPASLLDVGSGRGTFLWPLLNAFESLPVTAIDVSERRVADINAVHDGGIDRLTAQRMDVTSLQFETNRFDVVTALEVLEHLHSPAVAVEALIRVATRFVIVSVPSKPDNNPEHIQLFTPDALTRMLIEAGAVTVELTYVLNHMIAVAKV